MGNNSLTNSSSYMKCSWRSNGNCLQWSLLSSLRSIITGHIRYPYLRRVLYNTTYYRLFWCLSCTSNTLLLFPDLLNNNSWLFLFYMIFVPSSIIICSFPKTKRPVDASFSSVIVMQSIWYSLPSGFDRIVPWSFIIGQAFLVWENLKSAFIERTDNKSWQELSVGMGFPADQRCEIVPCCMEWVFSHLSKVPIDVHQGGILKSHFRSKVFFI